MGPINNVYIRALLNARNNARNKVNQAQDYGNAAPYLSGDPASGVVPFYEPNPDPYANLDRGPFQPSQPQYQPARPAMGVDALADIPVEMRRDPYAPVRYNAPPLPEMPSLRTPPARNIGYERKQEGKTALRAGLIGLLLGGGAGALAAATGASQGFQQGADRGYGIDYTDWANQSNLDRQQYDMAMRDYEAQSRQAQTQLGVDQTNRSLDAAANAEDIARERAAADQRMKYIGLASDFAPESQAPMLAYGEGRAGFPEGGFKPATKMTDPSVHVRAWLSRGNQLRSSIAGLPVDERRAAIAAFNAQADQDPILAANGLSGNVKLPPDIMTDAAASRMQQALQFGISREDDLAQRRTDNLFKQSELNLRKAGLALETARFGFERGKAITPDTKILQSVADLYNGYLKEREKLYVEAGMPKKAGVAKPAWDAYIARKQAMIDRADQQLNDIASDPFYGKYISFAYRANQRELAPARLRSNAFSPRTREGAPKPTPKPRPAASKATAKNSPAGDGVVDLGKGITASLTSRKK